MKIDFQNIDDLRAERARLKNTIELSKLHMRQEMEAIKTKLNPVHQVVGIVGNMFTAPHKGLLNVGVSIGVNTILKRGLLARAGWLPRLVIPFVVQNLATNLIYKNRTSFVENALRWVKKITDKPKQPSQKVGQINTVKKVKHLNGSAPVVEN